MVEMAIKDNKGMFIPTFFKVKGLAEIWALSFIFTALAAFAIQSILPVLFPKWHTPEGLLISFQDTRAFHNIAVAMADRIHSEGWSVWQLSPNGHTPAGIAAAIYALVAPKLWALIPLNAAVHATSVLILTLIFKIFTVDLRKAFLCALPFLLFPSAAVWYSQLHKDGFFILGAFFYIYGWLLLIRLDNGTRFTYLALSAFFCLILGYSIVFLIRKYILTVINIETLIVIFITTGSFIRKMKGRRLTVKKGITILFILYALTGLLLFFEGDVTNLEGNDIISQGSATEVSAVAVSKKVIEPAKTSSRGTSNIQSGKMTTKDAVTPCEAITVRKNVSVGLFRKISDKLLFFMENKLQILASKRKGFLTTQGLSNVDLGTNFDNFSDLLAYLPRAVQISLLSPFPSQWFQKGSYESNTIMRRIVGFEMSGIYLTLPFLFYAIWHWRRRKEIWIILVFCMTTMLFYTLVVCNIGTLYRLRYGFIMTLAGLGIAGAIQISDHLGHRHKQVAQSYREQ